MSVRSYPTLSAAVMRQGLDSYYRIWLIARMMDGDGRGYVQLSTLLDTLAGRCFTRRRARQIVNGEPGAIFWTIEPTPAGARLRYTGATALAIALDAGKLTGNPVALPEAALYGSIADFRAALHHSYLAGHANADTGQTGPISRRSLRHATGRSRVTQWRYEQAAGVVAHRNISVGEPLERHEDRERRNELRKAQIQDGQWEHGRRLFRFIDHDGRRACDGNPGADREPGLHYLAWNLPNTYTVTLRHAPRGRKRKINKAVNARVTRGRGESGERAANRFQRLFFHNPAGAARAFNRDPDGRRYWTATPDTAGPAVWRALEPALP